MYLEFHISTLVLATLIIYGAGALLGIYVATEE